MTKAVWQNKSLPRILIMAMALLIAMFGFSLVQGTSPAFAASKAKLTKTKVSVNTGASVKLSVKNAHKKVKWSISGKKCVTIKKKTGKYRQTIMLKAGTKAGSCWIKAKVGKKTLKCKVTVKKRPAAPGPAEPEVLQLSDSSVDLSSGYTFAPAVDTGSDADFDRAYTDFAVRLLQATLAEDTAPGNVLISPDSVITALAMTENGAAAETLTEMGAVLHNGVTLADTNEYLYRMHSRLAGSRELIYTNSNSIWEREGTIKAAPAFLQTNKTFYDASFFEAPFDDQTVSDMNRWVYNKTRNMIDQIIDPEGGLSADARFVLINAVAFEGTWPYPLVPVTKAAEQKFTSADQTSRTVNMMEGRCSSYLEVAGGCGFCHNYGNGEVVFMGLLPPEGMSARAYAASLSGQALSNAWQNRTQPSGGVIFHLPEFKYDYNASMKEVLKSMGMQRAFSANADFSGMIDPEGPDPTQTLEIDDVLHKTHIALDKKGTEAAAATAVIIEKSTAIPGPSEPKRVYLDRPFVYGLIDAKTGNPLFLGLVETL